MRVASGFWVSKTFWMAVSASVAIVGLCVQGHRGPTVAEGQTLLWLWAAVFVKDGVVKAILDAGKPNGGG